jgi:hypothetical protein
MISFQVTTEDQIQFYFKSSKKSNNGTDVNAGQVKLIHPGIDSMKPFRPKSTIM